jgi:hypothetical protein
MAEACTYDTSHSSFSCTLNGKFSETWSIVICCYGVSINADPISFPTTVSGKDLLESIFIISHRRWLKLVLVD